MQSWCEKSIVRGLSADLEFTTLICSGVFCRAVVLTTLGVFDVAYTLISVLNILSAVQLSNIQCIVSSSIEFNTGGVVAHFFTGM